MKGSRSHIRTHPLVWAACLLVAATLGPAPLGLGPASVAAEWDADRMVNALNDLDEMLRDLEDELVLKQKELHRVKTAIAIAEGQLTVETENAVAKKAELERNMKALYAFGQAGYVAMIFTASDLTDTLKRGDYLQRLIAYNKDQLEAYVRKVGELEARRVDLEKRRRKAAVEEQAVRQRIRNAVEKRTERLGIIARIRKDPQLQVVMARESAKHLKKLEETVAAVAEERPAQAPGKSSGLAAKKGALPWPARGVVEAVFGVEDDEVYGVKRNRKGWDIRARFLSEVAAVADGTVVHVGWMRGYGNVLVVDHGDGYLTIHAHLARAERSVGDKVSAGDTVGYVGDTASNKGPFLYFEIRHRGRPLDPAEWLERR